MCSPDVPERGKGSEGVQTGSGKHHMGLKRHPPIPQTGAQLIGLAG